MFDNKIRLVGTIENDSIIVSRLSGTVDVLPITNTDAPSGAKVKLVGRICSKDIDGHLKVFVRADQVDRCAARDDNVVELAGFICRRPNIRQTPNGRRVADFILAVPSGDEQYYVPVICWSGNADKAARLNLSDHISVIGRLQSRTFDNRSTVELSCNTFRKAAI